MLRASHGDSTTTSATRTLPAATPRFNCARASLTRFACSSARRCCGSTETLPDTTDVIKTSPQLRQSSTRASMRSATLAKLLPSTSAVEPVRPAPEGPFHPRPPRSASRYERLGENKRACSYRSTARRSSVSLRAGFSLPRCYRGGFSAFDEDRGDDRTRFAVARNARENDRRGHGPGPSELRPRLHRRARRDRGDDPRRVRAGGSRGRHPAGRPGPEAAHRPGRERRLRAAGGRPRRTDAGDGAGESRPAARRVARLRRDRRAG